MGPDTGMMHFQVSFGTLSEPGNCTGLPEAWDNVFLTTSLVKSSQQQLPFNKATAKLEIELAFLRPGTTSITRFKEKYTTARAAHTNVQVLAEFNSTRLHTSLVLVLTNNRTIRMLIDQSTPARNCTHYLC